MCKNFNSYISQYSSGGKIKIWLTGHSRGAAIANLMANSLSSKYGESNVVAYTFATPGVCSSSKFVIRKNIYNFLNKDDIVTKVPPKSVRYGRDISFSMSERMQTIFKSLTNKSYTMTKAYEAIHPISAICRKHSIEAYWAKLVN